MSVVVTFDTAEKGRSAQFPNYVRRGTIAVGAYATNGVSVTKTTFELPVSLDELQLAPDAGYVPEWDAANGKIKVFWVDTSTDGAPMAEVDNSTDLAAVTFRFKAVGR